MIKRFLATALALALVSASFGIGSCPAWAQTVRTGAKAAVTGRPVFPAAIALAGSTPVMRGAALSASFPILAAPPVPGFMVRPIAVSQAQPIGVALAAVAFPMLQPPSAASAYEPRIAQKEAAFLALAAAPWAAALADPGSLIPPKGELAAMPAGAAYSAGFALMDVLLGSRSIGGREFHGIAAARTWGAVRGLAPRGPRPTRLPDGRRDAQLAPPPPSRAFEALGSFALLSGLGIPAWLKTPALVALILAGTWLAAFLGRRLTRRLVEKSRMDPLLKVWVARGVSLVIWGTGLFTAFGVMGVSAELLATNTGLYGAAIGLAVKDVLKKVFDGWRFFSSPPFKTGDSVKLNFTESGKDIHEEGRVAAMNSRFVTLELSQNEASEFERVLIPNELLLPESVYSKKAALMGAAVFLGWGAKLAPIALLLLKLIATVVGTHFAARIVGTFVRRAAAKSSLDPGKVDWLVSVFRALSYALGALVVLHVLGVSLAWLVTSLGVISIGLGYLMSEFANDAFAGAILAIYRPFKIGDVIRAAGVEGRVTEITFRYVKIALPEGWTFSIPNFALIQKRTYVGKKTPAAPQHLVESSPAPG